MALVWINFRELDFKICYFHIWYILHFIIEDVFKFYRNFIKMRITECELIN